MNLIAPLLAAAFIPLVWDVETSIAKTVNFEAYHGETMSMSANMLSYGEPLDLRGMTAVMYWQTNGMGNVYWSTNAVVSGTNTLEATFTGLMDPGASTVSGFIGVTGENYHAAFNIRYRGSPGAVPNAIPLPMRTIDFSCVAVTNAPWSLAGRQFDLNDTTNCLKEIIRTLGGSFK